jgi:hypothetical protein
MSEIRELIQEAKREIRRASGVPLTEEDQIEERRLNEMKEMNQFIFDVFRIRLMGPLKAIVIWTGTEAATELTVERKVFHIRKKKNCYALFAIEEHGDRLLVEIEASDPLFASRVLVHIGESLSAIP